MLITSLRNDKKNPMQKRSIIINSRNFYMEMQLILNGTQEEERVHQTNISEMFLPQGYFLVQIAKTVINKISFPSLIIPLENDETTFGQIVSLYIQRAKITKEMLGNASLHLAIPKVGDISDDDTIYEIKCRLHNYSLNHLALQLNLKQNSFTYQCFQYYHFEEHEAYKNKQHPSNFFQIFVKIPQFSIGVYRMLNCASTIEDEIIKFLKQRRKQTEQIYQNIKPENIQIQCQACSQIIGYRGIVSEELKQHPTISIRFNDIKINKQIKEEHINKPVIVDIFESFGVKVGTFQYHRIFDHKVYTLLHFCKKVPNSKKKGLKIGSKLLKPYQFMTQLLSNATVHAESYSCYVVTECQMFYCSLPAKVPTFDIKKYSHILGENLNKVKEMRASRILQTQNQTYKQFSFIDPILIYTANKDYKVLNQFLRLYYFCFETQFSQQNQSQLWSLTHSLVNSLQKMPNYSGTVYRGVKYRDYIFDKIGKKQFFKTFTSTSICQNRARRFTDVNGTLFIIESLTGKNISSFSYFQIQKQVLFHPFTYFQVTAIDDSNPQLKKVYLREIPILHERNSNVLLWVDDRIEEGINLYNKYKLTYPRIKTELIQLLSNQHFQVWLQMFGYLLIGNQQKSAAGEKLTKKTTLITDMARGEQSQEGVETINIARRYLPDIDILVYIGNLQRARQILLRHNLQINDRLQVTNSPTILKQFLATRVFSPAELQTSCQLI